MSPASGRRLPAAGDRAPDASGLVRDGLGYPQRLFELLRGPEPVLLIRGADTLTPGEIEAVRSLRAEQPALRTYAIIGRP